MRQLPLERMLTIGRVLLVAHAVVFIGGVTTFAILLYSR